MQRNGIHATARTLRTPTHWHGKPVETNKKHDAPKNSLACPGALVKGGSLLRGQVAQKGGDVPHRLHA
eukprot:260477-Pelagomonas_calceolata.AAC.1